MEAGRTGAVGAVSSLAGMRSVAETANSRCVLAVRDLEVLTRNWLDAPGFRKDPIDAESWSFLTREVFLVMTGQCANDHAASGLRNHTCFAFCNVKGVRDLHRAPVARGAMVPSPPADRP